MDARSERLRRQILGLERVGDDDPNAEPLPTAVLRDYGIELVEVRLRRFTFPEAVRAGHRRAHPQRAAAEGGRLPERGEPRVHADRQRGRRDAAKTVAEAKAKRQRIEGEADAEADAIRNEAHSKDREFYAFLQKLAAYKAMLPNRDVLLSRRMSCSICC